MSFPLIGRKKKKSKKDQTLDTAASIAKAWGEWQLAKGAVKTAKRAPWKLVVAIGAGAAAAGIAGKKLLGRGGSSDATPPPPPAYTGPVPDPNAPTGGESAGTGEVGASPAAPVAPTDGPKLDPDPPATEK
jgi:hypothetical protein